MWPSHVAHPSGLCSREVARAPARRLRTFAAFLTSRLNFTRPWWRGLCFAGNGIHMAKPTAPGAKGPAVATSLPASCWGILVKTWDVRGRWAAGSLMNPERVSVIFELCFKAASLRPRPRGLRRALTLSEARERGADVGAQSESVKLRLPWRLLWYLCGFYMEAQIGPHCFYQGFLLKVFWLEEITGVEVEYACLLSKWVRSLCNFFVLNIFRANSIELLLILSPYMRQIYVESRNLIVLNYLIVK